LRVLKFIVNGQNIEPHPNCDFDTLTPGTEEYVRLYFTFSSEWNRCVKVVSFWSMLGNEYDPRILKDGISCTVPTEALSRRAFKFNIIGKRSDGSKITTEKFTIQQNGGST
jgi:hypothetical protein